MIPSNISVGKKSRSVFSVPVIPELLIKSIKTGANAMNATNAMKVIITPTIVSCPRPRPSIPSHGILKSKENHRFFLLWRRFHDFFFNFRHLCFAVVFRSFLVSFIPII